MELYIVNRSRDAFLVPLFMGAGLAVMAFSTVDPGLRRDGQGLAHRPLPSALGSNDGRC